jgi:AAA15 family ATPase/GTPase
VDITINIQNLKNISNLNFNFTLEPGVIAIIGANGCGKSSLMTCIAKLVFPGIFQKEFSGAYYNSAHIEYDFLDQSVISKTVWNKTPNWYAAQGYTDMLKLIGFYEASILNGTRFNNRTVHIHRPVNLTLSDYYLINSLNYITDSNKFNDLFYNRTEKRYALKITNPLSGNIYYIDELEFSTGEYFLLSVLRQMHSLARTTQRQTETGMLIIDEIEISLHPVAQQRFATILKQYAEDHNVLVFIATHSLQIIDVLNPNNVYLMENNQGQCTLSSPTYTGYVGSKLYNFVSYDRIILVEDELAKFFLQKIISTHQYCQNLTHVIIPIGGWDKVLEIALLNTTNHYFNSDRVLCILDKDIQPLANNRIEFSSILKNYLPCSNLERFTCENMFNDQAFRQAFQTQLYNNIPFNFAIPDPALFKTKQIKKQFSKYVNDLSLFHGHSADQAELNLVHFLVDYLAPQSNGLTRMLSTFLS